MSNLKMAIFYFTCGYIGNIFGAACDKHGSLFVGCGPATYAMFAAMISTLCVNWHALDAVPQMKCPLVLMLVLFTFMLMFNSLSGSTKILNYMPHSMAADWGGFMAGLFLGLIFVPRARARDCGPGSYGRLCTYIGMGLTTVYLGILLPLFFTVYDPPRHYFIF